MVHFRIHAFCWTALIGILLGSHQARGVEWPYHSTFGSIQVHADIPLDSYADLFRDLMKLGDEIRVVVGMAPCAEPIDLYLFGSEATYRAYMQRHFPALTVRRAMFIKAASPGNVFAYVNPELAVDLRHECTHALLHTALPLVPIWLDEGLAEYFEVPASQRASGNPHLATTRRRTAWKRPPSLEQLESLRDLAEMGPAEYRDAWAWVHFLLHGPPEARTALQTFLDELRNHEPPRPVSERLGAAFSRPDREFARHFARWR